MSLPFSESPLEPVREPLEQGPGRRHVRRTVLVVEDDPENRALIVALLASWGYKPLPVGSAEEAEVATVSECVAAAIVDVFLPGRSGTHLMPRLRERFPDMVVIGMSALGNAAMARQCKGHGADLFIQKPVRPDELAQALKSEHHSWH